MNLMSKYKLNLVHQREGEHDIDLVIHLLTKSFQKSRDHNNSSNFESCVWRTVSSHSSHHPQEVLLAQFSLYVHKVGLKPDSFYL